MGYKLKVIQNTKNLQSLLTVCFYFGVIIHFAGYLLKRRKL